MRTVLNLIKLFYDVSRLFTIEIGCRLINIKATESGD